MGIELMHDPDCDINCWIEHLSFSQKL